MPYNFRELRTLIRRSGRTARIKTIVIRSPSLARTTAIAVNDIAPRRKSIAPEMIAAGLHEISLVALDRISRNEGFSKNVSPSRDAFLCIKELMCFSSRNDCFFELKLLHTERISSKSSMNTMAIISHDIPEEIPPRNDDPVLVTESTKYFIRNSAAMGSNDLRVKIIILVIA